MFFSETTTIQKPVMFAWRAFFMHLDETSRNVNVAPPLKPKVLTESKKEANL